ncbi:MAG: family 10 glycosylhydrolase [Betaproteobacteria bacterium]
MAICMLMCGLLAVSGCAEIAKSPSAAGDTAKLPPPIPREFRAAWVATVANIDWPSRKGLSVEQQRLEIVRIVERAKELNLNALIFQVRPAADALYPSGFEPWSEYLTGEQGKAPEPNYDPLAVWIEESHRRGIELHAWFNPYRARHISAKGTQAPTHIANTHPAVVKEYGGYLWMDPGEPVAAQRTLDVILDVVRRYDIDGVHIDDYFYPYPVPVNASIPATENSPEVDFPDEPAWSRYLQGGGTLARADWRRQNVNELVERIHTGVHREKPWVRFGVSPFGLGRPDRRPAGIAGFSQYDKLYADVERWLAMGWMDYLAPQLYWPIDQPAQAFGVLMEYWLGQNKAGRHIWPGLFTSRIDSSTKSWKPEEIINQVSLMRTRKAIDGHIHFSVVALVENRQGIADQLRSTYQIPALTPAMPWLGNARLAAPQLAVRKDLRDPGKVVIDITESAAGVTRQYAIWSRVRGKWQFTTLWTASAPLGRGAPPAITFPPTEELSGLVVTPIDRFGNEGTRAILTADAIRGAL